jgi:glutamate-1-semialdehyde aminotransferase
VGNSGFIVPTKEFLTGLRELTKQEGALLCFDEVRRGAARRAGGEGWGKQGGAPCRRLIGRSS